MNLPRGNEVDPTLPRDNKSSCEREVTLAPGQSFPLTPLSNTPAGRRFFGGFLWEFRLLGGVQQNWAGQCEIVGWVGLSCLARYAMTNGHCLFQLGRCEPPVGPGQSPGGGPGGKIPGSSWNFAFSSG